VPASAGRPAGTPVPSATKFGRIGVLLSSAACTVCNVALDGCVATAAAGSHLITRQADEWEPSEAVARELTHDKAPEPTAEEGDEDARDS
jgi:hypothetical protein